MNVALLDDALLLIVKEFILWTALSSLLIPVTADGCCIDGRGLQIVNHMFQELHCQCRLSGIIDSEVVVDFAAAWRQRFQIHQSESNCSVALHSITVAKFGV